MQDVTRCQKQKQTHFPSILSKVTTALTERSQQELPGEERLLGRGVSVIRGGTLIVNLPGSPKAVRESLEFILGSLEHGLSILRGSASECAR